MNLKKFKGCSDKRAINRLYSILDSAVSYRDRRGKRFKIKDSDSYPQTLSELQEYGFNPRSIIEEFDQWAPQSLKIDFMDSVSLLFDGPESLDDNVVDYVENTYPGADYSKIVEALDKFLRSDKLHEFIYDIDRAYGFSEINDSNKQNKHMNLRKIKDSTDVKELASLVRTELDSQPESGGVEAGDIEGLNLSFSHSMDEVDMEDVYNCNKGDEYIDSFSIQYNEDWEPEGGDSVYDELDEWIESCIKNHNGRINDSIIKPWDYKTELRRVYEEEVEPRISQFKKENLGKGIPTREWHKTMDEFYHLAGIPTDKDIQEARMYLIEQVNKYPKTKRTKLLPEVVVEILENCGNPYVEAYAEDVLHRYLRLGLGKENKDGTVNVLWAWKDPSLIEGL